MIKKEHLERGDFVLPRYEICSKTTFGSLRFKNNFNRIGVIKVLLKMNFYIVDFGSKEKPLIIFIHRDWFYHIQKHPYEANDGRQSVQVLEPDYYNLNGTPVQTEPWPYDVTHFTNKEILNK